MNARSWLSWLGRGLVLIAIAVLLARTIQASVRDWTLAVLSQRAAAAQDQPTPRLASTAEAVIDRALATPHLDRALTSAALDTLQRAPSWPIRRARLGARWRTWLDQHLHAPASAADLRTGVHLAERCDPESTAAWCRQLLAAAPNSQPAIAAFLTASLHVTSPPIADADQRRAAIIELLTAWDGLQRTLGGPRLAWLGDELPEVIQARQRVRSVLRAAVTDGLSAYGLSTGDHGDAEVPDMHVLRRLDAAASAPGADNPTANALLSQLYQAHRRLSAGEALPPLVEAAYDRAMGPRHLTVGALVVAALAGLVPAGLLAIALVRFLRGSVPIDVDAETIQNIEPIDLDTDADTRTRHSGTAVDLL